ncbi:uncharacterized protein LOC130668527 [Microplitis mediator]|uniref:uncharacterized protein LOC130668527 n=1 Tax=Microplitis mediator TaxID=375433 RepID=UPI0025556272|nr:uncharacterized protein LOC130668527 [Microplitis mediator]
MLVIAKISHFVELSFKFGATIGLSAGVAAYSHIVLLCITFHKCQIQVGGEPKQEDNKIQTQGTKIQLQSSEVLKQIVESLPPKEMNERRDAPASIETFTSGRDFIREAFLSKGIDDKSADVMVNSIAAATLKQYQGPLKQWWEFCLKNKISKFNANTTDIIRFLTTKSEQSASYGTSNAIRSAISLISSRDISNDKLLSRFFKGIHRQKPPRPKYSTTWDTAPVLDYIENLPPLETLKLKEAAEKVATLLILTTAHRLQTISLINIKNIVIKESGISIKIPDLIKTSKPGKNQPELFLPLFQVKPKICVASAVKDYLKLTEKFRNNENDRLFISSHKPYKNVSAQTVSHWIKSLLTKAGIDTDQFTAYSTKHAAVSAAFRKGVDVDTIRRTAGWSKNSKTFATFYNRPIQDNGKFVNSVMTI